MESRMLIDAICDGLYHRGLSGYYATRCYLAHCILIEKGGGIVWDWFNELIAKLLEFCYNNRDYWWLFILWVVAFIMMLWFTAQDDNSDDYEGW